MIQTQFWKELLTTPFDQRAKLANKFSLRIDERLEAGKIINEGKIQEAFLKSVVWECKHSGLWEASKVLDKYEISGEERENIKRELNEWFYNDGEKNGTLFAKRLNRY